MTTRSQPDLATLIKRAVAEYKAMSPQQKEEIHAAQRLSWVRGELSIGDDEDERRYREAGDAERECLAAWMSARADWLLRGRRL